MTLDAKLGAVKSLSSENSATGGSVAEPVQAYFKGTESRAAGFSAIEAERG